MIGISTQIADVMGNVIFDGGDSNSSSIYARVSRTATLDGGCVINHYGVSQGDRTFRVSTKIGSEQKVILEHINETSALINISCPEGYFSGYISSIDTSRPEMKMTILIKERLS